MNSPPALDLNALHLLDGGLATQLESRGHNLNHRLWSARLLLECPQAIVDAHLAYLRAGAQCIISASYQASTEGFMSEGLTRAEAENLIRLSVSLCRQAVDQFCEESSPAARPLVAASVGPYGATQADGSEYHGNYDIDDEALIRFHRARLRVLCNSNADLLACETIPGLREARILNTLLGTQDKPAWLSFSARDGEHLNDGSSIVEAVRTLKDNKALFAVGINCTHPQYIPELIGRIRSATDKHIVVYPNSGEHFDALHKTWHGTSNPLDCAQAALEWRSAGATIVGGCCRIGPDHIRAMRLSLNHER